MASGSDIAYSILIVLGFLAAVIPPFVPFAQGNRVEKNEYITNVGVPSLVGLLSLLLGVTGLSWNHYNETVLFYLVVMLSLGTIFISISGSMIYATRLRYAS